MNTTTQASQLWCIEVHLDWLGWVRISPLMHDQAEAEYAMPKYANWAARKAIRATPFTHKGN